MKRNKYKGEQLFEHFRDRCLSRYSTKITEEDYNNFIKQIKRGESEYLGKNRRDCEKHLVKYEKRNKKILVIYDTRYNILRTALKQGGRNGRKKYK